MKVSCHAVVDYMAHEYLMSDYVHTIGEKEFFFFNLQHSLNCFAMKNRNLQ